MSRQKRKLEVLCQKSSSNRGGHSNTIHSSRGDHSYQNNHITLDHSDIHSGTQSTTNKWVINISDKPLSDAEEKLLAHGPNFAVVPKNPPIIQYVAAVEQACTKLEEGKAEEFRVQVKVTI